MADQNIPNGTYTLLGPGGQLTHIGKGGPIVIVPPDGSPLQQWAVEHNSGTYTLRNAATGFFLGNEGDPNEPAMTLTGSKQPFGWKLGQGPDEDPSTHVLIPAASNDGLVLTHSLLRVFPPHAAILPRSGYRDAEWMFFPA